jgi:cytochrome c biogenesis protein CcmG/thiol:disulfide interchange protein DsbE
VAFRSRIQKRWNQIGLVGRAAPDFGGTLAKLKGKPVVLFLWAEWCGDCKSQAPAFVNIVNKYGPRGVAFVAPTRFYEKDAAAEQKKIDAQWRTTYKDLKIAGVPVSEQAMITYGVSATPTFVVIDKKGIVRFYAPTRLTEQRLASEIDKVLR